MKLSIYIYICPKKEEFMEIDIVYLLIQLKVYLWIKDFTVKGIFVIHHYFPYKNCTRRYNGADKLNSEFYQGFHQ